MNIIVRTRYLGPTDYRGSRYAVTRLDTGERKVVYSDLRASNARTAAVIDALDVPEDAITYGGIIGDDVFHIVTIDDE